MFEPDDIYIYSKRCSSSTSTKKMASACRCIVLLFLLVAAGLSDAADVYNILELGMETRHEQWMAEYGRVYKDEAEKARRFEIFEKNVRYIEDFNNAGEYNYTLGVNEFADLTTEEFMSTHTGAADAGPPEEFELPESFELETEVDLRLVPSSFDWRDEGAVTEVKNQGTCSSCWAFASVSTVESLTKIKKGVLYSLSEQQVVDCDIGNGGCKPGYKDDAYMYMTGGITTDANYPYQGVQNYCDTNKAQNIVTRTTGYSRVRPYSESALKAAVAQQPVSVVLQITGNWQFFKSGLYSGPCGSGQTFGHAVAAVGYGETGTDKYWILRNSWGKGWSDNGYIKLARDVGISGGLCGIATYPSYPTMV